MRVVIAGQVVVIAIVLCGCSPQAAFEASAVSGPGVVLETVVDNLNFPVSMAFDPDGRLFVTEKDGQLRVIVDDTLVAEPALTLSVNSVGERGLLGVTLHPNFSQNGWIYLYYTTGGDLENRVARYTIEGNTALGPEEVIVSLPGSPGPNHNAGNLHFGPDAKLYVSIGDLTLASSAQDPDALVGRILRYNDDGSIPEDNPFGADNPTYALGLRNSFDFAFDPPTGVIFATENGTITHDEVNRIVAGGNYGWPEVQGAAGGDEFVDPLIDVTGFSVVPTGIDFAPNAFYGSDSINDLFYAQYSSGRVMQVDLSDPDRDELVASTVFLEGLIGISDLAFDPFGQMYILSLNANTLFRVARAP